VNSSGSKLWRFRYKFSGKSQQLSFGSYPDVPLADARDCAAHARARLLQGINPAEERRATKRESSKQSGRLFGDVAIAWWELQRSSWSEDHAKKVRRWISVETKPLNKLPVDAIDQGHITELMQAVEAAGGRRAAPTILGVISRIFGYALAHRLTRSNPAQGLPLGDILKPMPKVEHRAAITKPLALGQLIRDIDQTDTGSYCTVQALRLIPRVFLRPKEVRCLKWEYIDFEQRLIEIPAEDMKKDRVHLVPMADQVVEQLLAVQEFTGYSPYVFPSQRSSDKPLSKNVMTNRLRSLGYGADVMSAHGFRATASTILHETGWAHDVVEVQLAHLTGSATSRAYNRSKYLDERVKMMQVWADYLDGLRDGADVIPIGAAQRG